VFLGGHAVAVVAYCVAGVMAACSPMIGQLLGTMIVASGDEEWL